MSVKRFMTRSNSFQTAEQILAKPELQGLDPQAREVLQDMVESLGFERRDEAVKKEHKQYVLQGQLLVLGDARNGKTSLVKAITGEGFNANENKTKGVEFQYVNQKWKAIDLRNLRFGDFEQFSESFDCEKALWPRIFDQGKYRFRNGVVFGQELIFDDYAVRFLQHCGLENLALILLLRVILHQLIIPTILGSFFGDSCARYLTHGLLYLKYCYFLITNRMSASVMIILIFYFSRLGSSLSLWTFGCSEDPVPVRFSCFFGRLLGFGWPLYILNPVIFLLPTFYSSLLCIPFIILFQCIFGNCPWPIQLDFLLDFQEEIYLPLIMFLRDFFFFHPIRGLSCSRNSLVFPFDCCFIFTLHLILLYKQKLILKWYTMTVLALELAIIIPLCMVGMESVVYVILMNIILLCLGSALHIYGRWLEVKDDFKGKTFNQVFFHKDFIMYSIEIRKALVDVQKLKKALDETFCKLRIKILDFAGDEEYYAYHQIFLNSNALYIIVFNIQEYIQDNFKDIASKVKRLRFWLESIHSHVPQGTPIFLVGTHRADIKKDTLRQLNTYILNAAWHSFGDEIVLNDKSDLIFFHVENSRGSKDKGITRLRKKIKFVAEEEFKDVLGQEVPLSWIKVQDAIIQYRENRQGPVCVSVEDFKKSSVHLYIEWSDEMLKYFHKKGFVIYLDKDKEKDEGDKWVLLNPDVLVQIVILLISQPEEMIKKRGFRRHWSLLQKSGFVTKKLLKFIISQAIGEQETKQSSLITFLEEYDLICPLKDPFRDRQNNLDIKQTTHFVPSLLPTAAGTVWNESSDDIKFYIFFDSVLPDALFYRLLSRACKASYDEIESYEPLIYRDCGVFRLSQQLYRVRLLKNEGRIEVTLSKCTGLCLPWDILVLIGNIVESICNRDFQNLSFHCGPECSSPICPGSRSDVTSLLTGQPRRHVYNIYPACKQERSYFEDFFKCQNVFQEQDCKIWRPQKLPSLNP